MTRLPRHVRLSILAALILAGCPADTVTEPPRWGINVTTPGSQLDLLASAVAAVPCQGQPLVWSVREQTPAWTAIDGGVSQTGVWTAPGCGSAWLGQVLHVDATCPSTGLTGTVTVTTIPEQVSGVEVVYAMRTAPAPTCMFPDIAHIPDQPAGAVIQFYARVRTTCGEVVTPTPPATWPGVCP